MNKEKDPAHIYGFERGHFMAGEQGETYTSVVSNNYPLRVPKKLTTSQEVFRSASADNVDRFAFKEAADVIGDYADKALAGLQALPAHVGCNDHIVHGVERIVCSRRLSFLHIQTCTCNLPGSEGTDQGGLIDEGASGGIDQEGRGFHQGKRFFIDHVAGLVI